MPPTLMTSCIAAIISGPTPSPGIRVHVVFPSGFETGAC